MFTCDSDAIYDALCAAVDRDELSAFAKGDIMARVADARAQSVVRKGLNADRNRETPTGVNTMRQVNLATLEATVRDACKQGAICDSMAQHMLSQIGAQREENERDAEAIAHSDFREAVDTAIANVKGKCSPASMLCELVRALEADDALTCIQRIVICRVVNSVCCEKG